MSFEAPHIDWWSVAPQLILLGGSLFILLVSSLPPVKPPRWFITVLTLLTGVITGVVTVVRWNVLADEGPSSAIAGALAVDGWSLFVTGVVAVIVVVAALVTHDYLEREDLPHAETHALVMCAGIGAIVMAQATDLVVIFLGLETLSIALYILAAIHIGRRESQESAIKYFVLGAFSSAFFLYGIALIYGATGTTNLITINEFLSSVTLRSDGLLLVGLALLLVGFAFKVAAVPFHMWAPDVYQGAATPVAGTMAALGKLGGFAALVRVFMVTFEVREPDWWPLVWALAAASLLVGSVLALAQSDVKRMLAYSSISHAGYLLVAVESGTAEGASAVLFYLATYSLLVMGSFAVIGAVSGSGDRATTLDDLAGLAQRRPALALALTVLLLSQAGVPLTSGFVAKFYAIRASVDSGAWPLAVVAMLAAVVAAFFYLRIVMAMWMSDPDPEAPAPGPTRLLSAPGIGISLVVLITVAVGVAPQMLIETANDAVGYLLVSLPT